MAFFDADKTFLERDLFKGSDGMNYLRSPVIQTLANQEEYPKMNQIFRKASDWKPLFDAFIKHLHPSKGITLGTFLLSLGDLYQDNRIKKYQIEDYILKDIFPAGVADSVKSTYIYRDSDIVTTDGEDDRDTFKDTDEKTKGRGIWKYIPF